MDARRKYRRVWFADGEFIVTDEDFPRAVIAAKDAVHGDWKTALVRDFPMLRQGDAVELHEVWTNCYGHQARVKVGDAMIDVPPTSLNWKPADAAMGLPVEGGE